MDKLPQKDKFLLNVTLTELTFIIFLIFILLFSRKVFSLTKNVDTVNKTNEELSQRLEEANKNYINSLNQTELQRKTIDELSKNNDDLFKKLTLQESSVKKCEEFMNQFHEGDMSFTRLFDNEELLSEIKELKQDKSQLESKLKEFEKFEKNLADFDHEKPISENLASLNDVFENLGDCELAVNEAKSREKHLRRRCGNDWPACWLDSEGRQEFIYAVTLNENDLTVEGIWPVHRNDDIELIPNAKALPSDSMSLSDFEKNAEPILNWSKEKECRHYVKVIDNTAPTSKIKYKRMKQIVESYFYKFDVR
jgi:hypothetical protein